MSRVIDINLRSSYLLLNEISLYKIYYKSINQLISLDDTYKS